MFRAVGASAVGVGGVDAGFAGKPRARVVCARECVRACVCACVSVLKTKGVKARLDK